MKRLEGPDQRGDLKKEQEGREKIRNLNNSDLARFLLGQLAVFYDAQGVNRGRSTRSNLLDCVFDSLPYSEASYSEEGGKEIDGARTISYFVGLEEAEKRIREGKIPVEQQMEIEFPLNSTRDLSSERLVCGLLNFLLEEQEKTDKKNEIADFNNLCVERNLIKTASSLLPNFGKCPFSLLELMEEARERERIKIKNRLGF